MDENADDSTSRPAKPNPAASQPTAASRKHSSLSSSVDTAGMSEVEREMAANREKDKGNEVLSPTHALAFSHLSLH